jgi:MYXO-CTERM domain-containing protein
MRLFSIIILLALALASTDAAGGTISFSEVGIPSGATLSVNVSVTFTNVGGNLEIDLFNNAAGTDPLQILSGLVWNVSGAAPGGTSLSSAITGLGSELFTSGTTGAANAELRNSVLGGQKGWQYLSPPGQLNGASFQYGLGSSGLNGTFGGLANASYGVIGPGSNIGHVPLSNQLPLVMSTTSSPSEAVFQISGFNADVSRIQDVTFAFGSAGTNNIHVRIPEPSSFVLGVLGLLGLLTWRRRKRD